MVDKTVRANELIYIMSIIVQIIFWDISKSVLSETLTNKTSIGGGQELFIPNKLCLRTIGVP